MLFTLAFKSFYKETMYKGKKKTGGDIWGLKDRKKAETHTFLKYLGLNSEESILLGGHCGHRSSLCKAQAEAAQT